VLCFRLTRVLTLFSLFDLNIASFVSGYPGLFSSFPTMLNQCSAGFSIWCPALCVPLVFAVAVSLSARRAGEGDDDHLQSLVDQSLLWLQSSLQQIDWITAVSATAAAKKIEITDNDFDNGSDNNTAALREQPQRTSSEALAVRQDQLRLLDSAIVCAQLLSLDELRLVSTRIDFDATRSAARRALFQSLRICFAQLQLTVTRARGSSVSTGDSLTVQQLEKLTRHVKAVLTLLDGGTTSKAD
jgi:hypothetical protein